MSEEIHTVPKEDLEPGVIRFNLDDNPVPIIELRKNGDIYVKGKMIKNDLEVVDAMREFCVTQGLI